MGVRMNVYFRNSNVINPVTMALKVLAQRNDMTENVSTFI